MGHIKEPKGVDFIIKSEPLSEKEQAAISEYIRRYKLRYSKKKAAISKNKGVAKRRKKLLA
jgi:hypothetical protein